MIDREKVIKGLKAYVDCYDNRHSMCKSDCLLYSHGDCAKYVIKYINEAISMLKEQEAVKPHYNPRSNWYECGACRYSMTSGMHCRSELIPAYKVGFCAKCGKAVKWE